VSAAQVIDGGVMGSRRHLNIRGKSANLPAITDKDWRDIDFGIKMGMDFYALSFVRDAECILELQAYLHRHNSEAKVSVFFLYHNAHLRTCQACLDRHRSAPQRHASFDPVDSSPASFT
jgi:hypothetical protein